MGAGVYVFDQTTTMSSSLPPIPDILDLIVDHLHDQPTTLKTCCLVSKSWVPRTRRHLFALVRFKSGPSDLESWMKAFPDPSNSPAHHTRSLQLSGSKAVAAAISDAYPWVQSFDRIVDLLVLTLDGDDRHISFTRLHGLSPTLKSLHIYYLLIPPPEILNFICSFPLLEDLSLFSTQFLVVKNTDEWDAPPTSPKFTGTLILSDNDPRVTRKLLDLPGGLRFSKVSALCPHRDGDLTTRLVSMCSGTLESLRIGFDGGTFSMTFAVDWHLIATHSVTHAWRAAIS